MASITAIQTLTDLSARQSEEAAVRLGQANANLAKAKEKLNILQEYHQSYSMRLQQDMTSGLSITQYNNYMHFLSNLDRAVKQQHQDVAMHVHLVEQQHREWQNCERKRLSFETLKTRSHNRILAQEIKREQKLNDEFAGRAKRMQS